VERRDDIEDGYPIHPRRMIECEAMSDSAASVVTCNPEHLVAKCGHDRRLVGRHCALAVGTVLVVVDRGAALSISAQVRDHDTEIAGKYGRDIPPHEHGFRIAMKEEQRGPTTSGADVDRHVADI
jgi:hypothetical protein